MTLPNPGAEVTIWDVNDRKFAGEFVGLEDRILLIRDRKINNDYPLILDVVQKIITNDMAVDLGKDLLSRLMREGEIPYRSQILLDKGYAKMSIDTDQANHILVRVKEKIDRIIIIVLAEILVSLLNWKGISDEWHGIFKF